MSEVESRAIADFAFDHPNIAAVLTFTPEDNLFEPWKPGDDGGRIKTSLLTANSGYFNHLAQHYRTIHGGKDARDRPAAKARCRSGPTFSLAAGPWRPGRGGSQKSLPKPSPLSPTCPSPRAKRAATSQPTKAAEKPAAKARTKKRGADDVNALAWFAQEGIDGFADWQAIDDPDFPGKKVEVGGFPPFLRTTPPAKELDGLADKHLKFLVKLGELMPRVAWRT